MSLSEEVVKTPVPTTIYYCPRCKHGHNVDSAIGKEHADEAAGWNPIE